MCQFLKHHPGVTYIGENTAGCYAEISGEAFRGKFGYGVKIGSTHASFENNEIFERNGFPVDINTSGQDAYSYTLANIEAIKEQSRKKITEYTHPTSKKEFNKLANNDFAFIRAINTGMDIEDVKGLYESLYPDKKENFESVVQYANNGSFGVKTTKNNEANRLMVLRGISPSTKAPYKPKEITINPNTLRLYQDKKQNS